MGVEIVPCNMVVAVLGGGRLGGILNENVIIAVGGAERWNWASGD